MSSIPTKPNANKDFILLKGIINMDGYQQTINFELNSTILILAAAELVAVVSVAPHRVKAVLHASVTAYESDKTMTLIRVFFHYTA